MEDVEQTRQGRWFRRAYAASCAAHLTLPDAWEPGWLLPDLFLAAGAIALVVRGERFRERAIGAWLSVVGLAWPLLALGDQLTQSGYMLAGAVVLGTTVRWRDVLASVRVLTLAVYAAAVFHKLNTDFFDPSVSCATAGMQALAENWSLPLAPSALRAVWPTLFVATEITLVGLLIVRPAFAWLLALVMHIPLTIIFAPSFAWVMLPGWLAFATDADIGHIEHVARTRRRVVLALGLGLGAMSAMLYFRDHWVAYPAWQLKELGLWLLLALIAVAFVTRTKQVFQWRGAWREGRVPRRGMIVIALFVACLATPYTGLQFHHAGAMLSNLRVDAGCWNHLLVPEAARLREPYVRIETVSVGEVRGRAALEELIREQLWHPASLRDAARRYCAQGAGPIALEMMYGGHTLRTEDACRALPLPAQPRGLFQQNLLRECPQRCIH